MDDQETVPIRFSNLATTEHQCTNPPKYLEYCRSQLISDARKNIIQKYNKEKEDIVSTLQVALSNGHVEASEKQIALIEHLISVNDTYEEMTKAARKNLSEIGDSYRCLINKLKPLRENMSDVVGMEEARRTARHHTRDMGQLQVALSKLDKSIERNQRLRADIETEILNRARFKQTYEELMDGLQKTKTECKEKLHLANVKHQERDDSWADLDTLRKSAHECIEKQEKQLSELKVQMEDLFKLHEFVGVKCQKRDLKSLRSRHELREQESRKRRDRLISEYKVLVAQLHSFWNDTSIERIMSKYNGQEDDVFQLYTNVIELNKMVDELQVNLAELRDEIHSQCKVKDFNRAYHSKRLQDMRSELDILQKGCENADQQLDIGKRQIEKLIKLITNACKIAGCDNSPPFGLLGWADQINTHTVLSYLPLLEKRVLYLLTMVYFTERREGLDGEVVAEVEEAEEKGAWEAEDLKNEKGEELQWRVTVPEYHKPITKTMEVLPETCIRCVKAELDRDQDVKEPLSSKEAADFVENWVCVKKNLLHSATDCQRPSKTTFYRTSSLCGSR